MPRSSKDKIFDGIVRKTAPAPTALIEGIDSKSCNPRHPRKKNQFLIDPHSRDVADRSLCRRSDSVLHRDPWVVHLPVLFHHRRESSAGRPAERCKSDAFCLALNAKSSVISMSLRLTLVPEGAQPLYTAYHGQSPCSLTISQRFVRASRPQ